MQAAVQTCAVLALLTAEPVASMPLVQEMMLAQKAADIDSDIISGGLSQGLVMDIPDANI